MNPKDRFKDFSAAPDDTSTDPPARTSDAKEVLRRGFEKALTAQQPVATANVARLRRVHPDKSPEEIARILTRTYLATVSASGAASGATAVVPSIAVPIAAALADILVFTDATVLYALSLAEVHRLNPEDFERRKLLVLAVLTGDTGTRALQKALGRTVPHWAKEIVSAVPMTTINKLNRVLGPRFITKYGTKQGILVLSKQVPLGIGAALGAGGNYGFGRLTVASARKIFGPPPVSWPEEESEPLSGTIEVAD